METNYSYLFILIALFLTAFVFGLGTIRWNALITRTRLVKIGVILGLCFFLDQIGLAHNLWTFPSTGTLPIRVFNLPLEEYVCFFLFVLLCLVFGEAFAQDYERTR